MIAQIHEPVVEGSQPCEPAIAGSGSTQSAPSSSTPTAPRSDVVSPEDDVETRFPTRYSSRYGDIRNQNPEFSGHDRRSENAQDPKGLRRGQPKAMAALPARQPEPDPDSLRRHMLYYFGKTSHRGMLKS